MSLADDQSGALETTVNERDSKGRPFLECMAFIGFLVLVVSLAIQKPSIYVYSGLWITATDVLFPLVAIIVAIAYYRHLSLLLSLVYFIIFAYATSFAISAFLTPTDGTGPAKAASILYLVGLALMASFVITNEERLKKTIVVWSAAAFLPFLVGLAAIVIYYIQPTNELLPYITHHFGAVPVGNFPRVSSTFVSASMFCNYANVAILMLLIANARGWIPNNLFWPCICIALMVTVFTVSSGLGAVALAIAIWLRNRLGSGIKGNGILVFGILICLAFLATSIVALQPHATAPFVWHVPYLGIDVYPSPRLMIWAESVRTFADNFLTGNGPGSPSASVLFHNTDGTYSVLTDAHNSFLSVAAQTGIIGLSAFSALCVSMLRLGNFRKSSDPIRFGLWTAFLTAFVIQGLTGAFEDARHLWVLMGMMIAADRIGKADQSESSRTVNA